MSYSIQVRRYSPQGSYQNTVKEEDSSREEIKATVMAWLSDHYPEELEVSMQTNPCNIMVRKDGKLISYKSL